jgi:predicted DNA-binding transcriptional regulator AlpA
MRRALLVYFHYLWPQPLTHEANMNYLNTLPPDLGRNRVLDSRKSAEFWGVSLPHWRRLYRAGKVPRPIRIGDRKYGWRVGDLIDGLTERAKTSAPREVA